LTALSAEHGFRVIDSPTKGALLTTSLLLLLLLLHHGLQGLVFPNEFLFSGNLLRAEGPLSSFCILSVIVYHYFLG
jgi:hypothetical protein